MKLWNNTRPHDLTDIWGYNEKTKGYWSQWVDSTPYTFPNEYDWFTTKTTGFLVAPSSGKYILHLDCDDRCELYLSNSSRPEYKVRTKELR